MTSTARQPCTAGGGGGGGGPRAGGRGSPGSAARPHTAFNGADGPRRDSHTGVSHRAGPQRGGEAAPPRPPGHPPAYEAPRPGGLARRPANGRTDLPPALERPLRPNESSEDTAAKCWGGLEGPPWGGSCALACRRGQPAWRIGLMGSPARPNQKRAGEEEGGGKKHFLPPPPRELVTQRVEGGGGSVTRASGRAARPGGGARASSRPRGRWAGAPRRLRCESVGGGYLSEQRGRALSRPGLGLPQRADGGWHRAGGYFSERGHRAG